MFYVSFGGLIAKNLVRQPGRAVLTLIGITVGITTVVALGVITAGLRETAGAFVRSGAPTSVAQTPKGTGVTLVVVSHDPDVSSRADRLLRMLDRSVTTDAELGALR